jgi:hypothetical protein
VAIARNQSEGECGAEQPRHHWANLNLKFPEDVDRLVPFLFKSSENDQKILEQRPGGPSSDSQHRDVVALHPEVERQSAKTGLCVS